MVNRSDFIQFCKQAWTEADDVGEGDFLFSLLRVIHRNQKLQEPCDGYPAGFPSVEASRRFEIRARIGQADFSTDEVIDQFLLEQHAMQNH